MADDPDFMQVTDAGQIPAAIQRAHETVRQVYDGLAGIPVGGPRPDDINLRISLGAVRMMITRNSLARASYFVGGVPGYGSRPESPGLWRQPLYDGTPAPDPDRYIAADGSWSAWRQWPDVLRQLYNRPPVDEYNDLPLAEHPVDPVTEWRRAEHAARSVRKSDSGSRRQQQAWSRRRDRLADLAVSHYQRLVPVFEDAVQAAFLAAVQGGPTPSAPVPITKGRPSWR